MLYTGGELIAAKQEENIAPPDSQQPRHESEQSEQSEQSGCFPALCSIKCCNDCFKGNTCTPSTGKQNALLGVITLSDIFSWFVSIGSFILGNIKGSSAFIALGYILSVVAVIILLILIFAVCKWKCAKNKTE